MATHVEAHRHLDHERDAPHRVLGVLERVIDWLFGALYALLFVRFMLELFGARDVGFVRIIGNLTDVFYAPFKGIFATTTIGTGIGTGHFVWPLLVAIVGYMLLHALIRGLLHLLWRAT